MTACGDVTRVSFPRSYVVICFRLLWLSSGHVVVWLLWLRVTTACSDVKVRFGLPLTSRFLWLATLSKRNIRRWHVKNTTHVTKNPSFMSRKNAQVSLCTPRKRMGVAVYLHSLTSTPASDAPVAFLQGRYCRCPLNREDGWAPEHHHEEGNNFASTGNQTTTFSAAQLLACHYTDWATPALFTSPSVPLFPE